MLLLVSLEDLSTLSVSMNQCIELEAEMSLYIASNNGFIVSQGWEKKCVRLNEVFFVGNRRFVVVDSRMPAVVLDGEYSKETSKQHGIAFCSFLTRLWWALFRNILTSRPTLYIIFRTCSLVTFALLLFRISMAQAPVLASTDSAKFQVTEVLEKLWRTAEPLSDSHWKVLFGTEMRAKMAESIPLKSSRDIKRVKASRHVPARRPVCHIRQLEPETLRFLPQSYVASTSKERKCGP